MFKVTWKGSLNRWLEELAGDLANIGYNPMHTFLGVDPIGHTRIYFSYNWADWLWILTTLTCKEAALVPVIWQCNRNPGIYTKQMCLELQ